MQKDTKKAIKDTFLELLRTKPFDKITVRDVVETCGINRNTFYYYYSDIYDLLEEVFKKELTELVTVHETGASWIKGFTRVGEVAYSNKKIINNICSSRSYDYLENYMFKACSFVIVDLVNQMAEGMEVPSADIEFISSFYEHAFFGIISEWFRTGMRETPEELAQNFWLVISGIKIALQRSEKKYRAMKRRGNV